FVEITLGTLSVIRIWRLPSGSSECGFGMFYVLLLLVGLSQVQPERGSGLLVSCLFKNGFNCFDERTVVFLFGRCIEKRINDLLPRRVLGLERLRFGNCTVYLTCVGKSAQREIGSFCRSWSSRMDFVILPENISPLSGGVVRI